ncbi:hypothetical protein [Pseudarthrobacter phenanthrenivorans]|uniref:Uncharacterized protein n=1 Tax=Pseudarthrobacter phenanthrenivorans TaxID=361575 RepID=A0A0B4EPP9_PSEPS|nr:hypothetical protein [Pseudarthrobacter phenanthrenivorans]KIC68683.1 hypothetical protein RM50_04245 [Pseudarthrobacter phenanthrenivorans]
MAVVVEIPARAAIRRAQVLRVRAQVAGTSILAHTATNDIAEAIETLAGSTDEISIKAAADQLWEMTEAERIEALSMEEDDPKSYLAALYSPAAA